MHAPIEKVSLAELFTDARTHHAWQQKDVSDELLNQVFDLAKWAPTSLNSLPARFLFVKSKAAKAKQTLAVYDWTMGRRRRRARTASVGS